MAQAMRGMDELLALFDTLPGLTDDQLKKELPDIGSEILALQTGAVPVFSGQLQSALSVQVIRGGFTVRVGLLGTEATSAPSRRKARRQGAAVFSYGPNFYGRIVEFGRKGQVVQVQRRRRVNGALRTVRRRKLAADIVATYTMKVQAEDARPFIDTPATEAAALDAGERLATFWDGIIGDGETA